MTQEIRNKIEFIVVCIGEFARTHGLTPQRAYRYLRQWRGLDFMDRFYDVAHLRAIEDTVDDLTAICLRNGGRLA